uniref:Transmembrane protein n=1 Tax=Arundo donax TaxID=35708 RepID=A0A0A8ZFW5_ARUDO
MERERESSSSSAHDLWAAAHIKSGRGRGVLVIYGRRRHKWAGLAGGLGWIATNWIICASGLQFVW